jgi:hypothetical protein
MRSLTSSLLAITALAATACGGSAPATQSATKEAFDPSNNPLRLSQEVDWTFDPDVMPTQGHTARRVWTGNYFPSSQEGTASAMDKYDRATGNDGRAGRWEREDSRRNAVVSWSGHCNGLAAAGINEEEPTRAVTYRGVDFSVDDVKALLVEKWQRASGSALMVGRRCNQADVALDEDGRPVPDACRDFNAGAMHVILGNFLGLKGEGVVFDMSRDEQVWNYPVVGYEIESSEVIDAAAATRLVGGGTRYRWNPRATQFMKVRSRVRFAGGQERVYDYVLEGDDDVIIGGEWVGGSKLSHPDFAWRMTAPAAVNPYLDLGEIDAIARRSR